MKRSVLLLSLCVIAVFSYASLGISIIPQPESITQRRGVFNLDSGTNITVTSTELMNNAAFFIKEIHSKHGLMLSKKSSARKKNDIILAKDVTIPPEGYHIEVSTKEIKCEASTPAGMFYAIQTLLQSLSEVDGVLSIPAMAIEDAPAYQWRGMMLDVSRHFYGKETIKELLDAMAYLKMNRFHWHLTDENGWRIEIKKYPRLTDIGAEGNWSDRHAPVAFYTQEDIREIVAYARERHIMVIPEIDMPGHATAATKAYPEVSAGGTGRWAGFTFHPAKETTYEFIDNVLTEIAELFPAPYIHIGGDEVHFGNQVWFTDPLIKRFIRANGLKDELDLEHYFIRRVCDMIRAKGKKMIGWDEIINSGVSPDHAVAMWWRHDKPGQMANALNNGFQVIMTPRLPCYFDFVQDDTQKIGRRWDGRFNTLASVYDFSETVKPLIESRPNQIMGMQACVWTERIASTERLYYMIFPRLAAIAENGWVKNKPKEYVYFLQRIEYFLDYLDEKGINYFDPFDKGSTPEPWGPTKADVIAEG